MGQGQLVEKTEDRDKLHAAMRIAVRESVARQRRLTHATGIPERPVVIRPGPVSREVDNPLITDGLYFGGRKDIARIEVQESATTRIGALAFIPKVDKKATAHQPRRRYPHHELAAQRFKSDYEALYGGAAPAVDPSKEPVDTSVMAHDNGLAARLDRGARLAKAMEFIGKGHSNEMIDMLIFCTPCSAYAEIMPSGQRNQRQIANLEERRLSILDTLAIHWGFQSRRP